MGKNILVAHGGGPTAVINCSLQGVVEAARDSGKVDKIYAARFGAEGILSGDLIDLTDVSPSAIAKLSHTPASAIGSCRRKLTDADYPTVLETLRKFEIDCFFYNGGNDSMDTCHKVNELAKKEGLDLRVIGIPKTMDNDLEITDHCPGFGSAARYAALSAAELALDASGLPIHVVVLELMEKFPPISPSRCSRSTRTPCCGLRSSWPTCRSEGRAMSTSYLVNGQVYLDHRFQKAAIAIEDGKLRLLPPDAPVSGGRRRRGSWWFPAFSTSTPMAPWVWT